MNQSVSLSGMDALRLKRRLFHGRTPYQGWLAAAFLLALAAPTGWAEGTNSLPVMAKDLPNMGTAVLRMVGSLGLVLALFLGGVWCFKNWQRLTVHRGRPSRLQVLEVKPLGNKQTVYLVGYEQQRMLLGSSNTGVTLITHLPDAEEEETETPETTFVQNLHSALNSRS